MTAASDGNPYQAPKAPVEDVVVPPPEVVRPLVVQWAVLVLWIAFALEMIGDTFTLRALEGYAGALALFSGVTVATLAAFALVAIMIGRRRHWARMVLFIYTVCASLFSGTALLRGTLSKGTMVEICMLILASILLLTPKANEWFRSGRAR